MANEKKVLEYKGRPLRRKDNILYYGSMDDKYIIMLQILETKPVTPLEEAQGEDALKAASKVSVQLQLTDPNVKSRDRVTKRTEKDSLYAAMDVASIWLERALSQK
ncbi:MAG: hypothetical protein KBS46_00565 [Clostridiales bacterium]|nr:hypothetical protein [Candidatus Apopatocola equi]MCQ2439324.1 hypothetical protein [Oscillospiraceae bacterium]